MAEVMAWRVTASDRSMITSLPALAPSRRYEQHRNPPLDVPGEPAVSSICRQGSGGAGPSTAAQPSAASWDARTHFVQRHAELGLNSIYRRWTEHRRAAIGRVLAHAPFLERHAVRLGRAVPSAERLLARRSAGSSAVGERRRRTSCRWPRARPARPRVGEPPQRGPTPPFFGFRGEDFRVSPLPGPVSSPSQSHKVSTCQP
jgi:hypothetical protein